MRFRWGVLAALLVGLHGSGAAQGEPVARPPFRFVVLGHIRGEGAGLNPKLGEVLTEVRRAGAEAVVLTGDLIWGDYNSARTDSAAVEREWQQVDSALATLGVPILRVPGNHDINDGVTRDIWRRRYGALPRVEVIGGTRFLLLSSAWIPQPGDTGKARFVRGHPVDSAQVAFLRDQLAAPGGDVTATFVAMHHLLWWEPDTAAWWRDVHPELARAGVAAVFSGDYGPMKFSTMERDGVRYFQTSIEGQVSDQMQGILPSSRLLSSQFDNFLVVDVVGSEVSVEIRVVAGVSSGQFTPARWRAIEQISGARPPRWQRLWNLIGTPKRLTALGGGMMLVFLAGVWLGRSRWPSVARESAGPQAGSRG